MLKYYYLEFTDSIHISSYFERLINAVIYEIYFPNAIQKAKCEIKRHLQSFPAISKFPDESTKDINLKTVKDFYKEISSSQHPVNSALLKLLNVEEVKIIESKE
jgi:hypothetical protein